MIRRANTMTRSNRLRDEFIALTLACAAATARAQAPVEVVRVVSKAVERQVKLPGEFQPYLAVPIHAKVTGFVKAVNVEDRKSTRLNSSHVSISYAVLCLK